MHYSHIDLAKGELVRAAGWVRFEEGKVISVDNASADYQTDGIRAKFATMKAFIDQGFNITGSCYKEKIYSPDTMYETTSVQRSKNYKNQNEENEENCMIC